MASFDSNTPRRLVLTAFEQAARARNRKGDGPVPYAPIEGAPAIYSHVGHAINYGRDRRNGRTVRLLILHTTEGSDSFVGNMAYEAHRSESVSATAFVGPAGEIGADVPEASRPWTTGRWNDESLTVEVMGRAAWSPAQWRARPAQLDALTRLLVDWCIRYSIPPAWLTPGQVAEGASRQSDTPRQGIRRGITDHLDANLAARLLGASSSSTSHHDIGPGLREVVLTDIIPEVARIIAALAELAAGGTPPAAPQPTTTSPTFRTFHPKWSQPMTTLNLYDGPDPRLLDTRDNGGARLAARTAIVVDTGDPDATAAIVNITVDAPIGAGHGTAWQADSDKPVASCINFAAGQTVANCILVAADAGRFRLEFSQATHVIVDIVGTIS